MSLLHPRLTNPRAWRCSLARRQAYSRPPPLARAKQHGPDSPGRREQPAGDAQGGPPAGGSGSGPRGSSPAAGGFKGFGSGQARQQLQRSASRLGPRGQRAPGGSGGLPQQDPPSAGAPPLPPGENPGWAQQEELRAMERAVAAERQGLQDHARVQKLAAAALASLEGPDLTPSDDALTMVQQHVRWLLGQKGTLAASPREEALKALAVMPDLLEEHALNAIPVAYWHLALVGGSPSGCCCAVAWDWLILLSICSHSLLLPMRRLPAGCMHHLPPRSRLAFAAGTSSGLSSGSLLVIPWPAAAGLGIPGPRLPAAQPQH